MFDKAVSCLPCFSCWLLTGYCGTLQRVQELVTSGLSQMHDLDFADGIGLLSHTYQHPQVKFQALAPIAKLTDLNIHKHKTKTMTINNVTHNVNPNPVTLENEGLEDVSSFTYLGSVISRWRLRARCSHKN